MAEIKIRDIRTIVTAPDRQNLVVVRVDTTEPGLYGLGCATLAYRYDAVCRVVEKNLKPLLVGRDVSRIEDLWKLMMHNSYWRNGPILNNAVSGIDMALWDIKGKLAGMPLYDLFGGKCREYVTPYRHANCATKEEIFDLVDQFMEEGFHYIRSNYTSWEGPSNNSDYICLANKCKIYDPRVYTYNVADLMESLRARYGSKIELMTDVHERIDPNDAVYLAKRLEDVHMFFLEDALSPEQGEWARHIKSICSTPLAIGELYVNPTEWLPLVKDRLIDYIRFHASMVGGLTAVKKAATVCEAFGVKTAFHGSLDMTPIGLAAQMHLDLAAPNFGIQEFYGFSIDNTAEVFPGCPYCEKGMLLLGSDKPGIGVEIDEKLAAKFPPIDGATGWTEMRLPDGTLHTP